MVFRIFGGSEPGPKQLARSLAPHGLHLATRPAPLPDALAIDFASGTALTPAHCKQLAAAATELTRTLAHSATVYARPGESGDAVWDRAQAASAKWTATTARQRRDSDLAAARHVEDFQPLRFRPPAGFRATGPEVFGGQIPSSTVQTPFGRVHRLTPADVQALPNGTVLFETLGLEERVKGAHTLSLEPDKFGLSPYGFRQQRLDESDLNRAPLVGIRHRFADVIDALRGEITEHLQHYALASGPSPLWVLNGAPDLASRLREPSDAAARIARAINLQLTGPDLVNTIELQERGGSPGIRVTFTRC